MTDIVILGAGGHGRETLDIVEALNDHGGSWNFVGFIDDGPGVADRLERRGAAIIGDTAAMESTDAQYVIGIGGSETRAKLDAQLTAWGRTAATLIHPAATVASDNRVSDGVLLAAGARVTTNVTLGRHVHLNVNAVVSHDCVLGDYVTLSPGTHINGDVTVGAAAFFGTGAIVAPGLTIGSGAVIGAGAVVVHDVPDRAIVKGVPGRW